MALVINSIQTRRTRGKSFDGEKKHFAPSFASLNYKWSVRVSTRTLQAVEKVLERNVGNDGRNLQGMDGTETDDAKYNGKNTEYVRRKTVRKLCAFIRHTRNKKWTEERKRKSVGAMLCGCRRFWWINNISIKKQHYKATSGATMFAVGYGLSRRSSIGLHTRWRYY